MGVPRALSWPLSIIILLILAELSTIVLNAVGFEESVNQLIGCLIGIPFAGKYQII